MIVIKEDDKSYFIQCECGHRIRHPKEGNNLIKCYTCGTMGTLKIKYGLIDIRTKQPNLKYALYGEQDRVIF